MRIVIAVVSVEPKIKTKITLTSKSFFLTIYSMSNFLSSKSLMRVWYSWITFLIAAIDSFTCFLLVLTKHKLITLMTVCHVFSIELKMEVLILL